MLDASVRQRLIQLGTVATILGALHHLDHIARGNHVGWPSLPHVTPFTPSPLIYAVLLPGIYWTVRGKVGPRYWLWTAVVLLLIVVGVHFNPDPRGESLRDIYMPYAAPADFCGPSPSVDPPAHGAGLLCGSSPAPSRPWLGVLALANLFLLIAVLIALLRMGWRYRRATAQT